jgi:hypothetical protein
MNGPGKHIRDAMEGITHMEISYSHGSNGAAATTLLGSAHAAADAPAVTPWPVGHCMTPAMLWNRADRDKTVDNGEGGKKNPLRQGRIPGPCR